MALTPAPARLQCLDDRRANNRRVSTIEEYETELKLRLLPQPAVHVIAIHLKGSAAVRTPAWAVAEDHPASGSSPATAATRRRSPSSDRSLFPTYACRSRDCRR